MRVSDALVAAALAVAGVALSGAFTAPAQAYYYGYYGGPWPYAYGYRPPPCPYRYHWDCWTDVYGRRGCGCVPDSGLYTGFY